MFRVCIIFPHRCAVFLIVEYTVISMLVGVAVEGVLLAAPNQVGIFRLIAAAAPYSGRFCRHYHALYCNTL